MPEAESPPDQPGKAQSLSEDNIVRAGDDNQLKPSLNAGNSSGSHTCSEPTPRISTADFTSQASAVHSPINNSLAKLRHHLSEEPMNLAQEVEAIRSIDESNEIEVSRPAQPRTPARDSNRVAREAWMDLFNVEEEIGHMLHDMSDEDLCCFLQANEGSTNDYAHDEYVELQIYTCFLIFQRMKSPEHLQQAIQLTDKWNATLAADNPHHTRRCQISDLMSAWEVQLSLILEAATEDFETSLSENNRTFTFTEAAKLHEISRLFQSYECTGNLNNLKKAIGIAEQIVNECPMSPALGALATMLLRLYERTNSMTDLDRAVEVANKAVDLHPDQNQCWNTLGALLLARYRRMGLVDNLNRAIDIFDNLVMTTPTEGFFLQNLATSLALRFHLEGSMDDLERGINVAKMVPPDQPHRANSLNLLGDLIGHRFKRTGSTDDLNQAIDILSTAVDCSPQGHPFRVGYLHNLGIWLGRRFKRAHSLDDLNRAINVVDMAVGAIPQDHPDRPNCLITLGGFLCWRSKRIGSLDDLDRAIEMANTAVNATPPDHPDRACWLNNLAMLLGERFKRGGTTDHLNRAISAADLAVKNTNPGIDKATRLHNLGDLISIRFREMGSSDDLDRAIVEVTMAVNAMPQDHPERSSFLNTLGTCLHWRSGLTGSVDDLNSALSYFKVGWSCHTSPSSDRISLASGAAEILALQSKWKEASQLLSEAVNLLPTVSTRSLKHTDKQYELAKFAGLASFSAAMSLNETEGEGKEEAYEALKLLELGRGIIASILMDMRMDVSDLKQKYPSLANEFVSLRDELDSPADKLTSLGVDEDVNSWQAKAKQRREADQRLSELVTTIRTKPEFHNFLLPPTEDELMDAADLGPIVVVNLSPYRCDAFIIERRRIRVLRLRDLAIEQVRKRVSDLRSPRSADMVSMLRWLWEAVCHPCLEVLGFHNSTSIDNCPHIWWIPTGLLSQLPLHAAGCYQSGSTDNTVLDRVISSYASSIKSLVRGRRHHIDNPPQSLSDGAVLVAMHTTPGLSTNGVLPFAVKEVSMLKSLCVSLQLRPTTPALRKDDILQSLSKCKVFHFAGHGESKIEPSESTLLLEDWQTNPLTVGDLRDHRLQENPPFLGYLSACSTGSNMAEDLADEAIHLIGALQLAGFRHVVGTLWKVSDEHCLHVARILYETLRDEGMTDISVSRGLHRAIKQLRDKEIKMEVQGRHCISGNSKTKTEARAMTGFYWVPYIHFGV
ncbi:CHAT domain-containing protein [Xylaria scruposa]|nr:CHAT domain-containing protein [Xylaria scruposa]